MSDHEKEKPEEETPSSHSNTPNLRKICTCGNEERQSDQRLKS